jgi:hypothetical protein
MGEQCAFDVSTPPLLARRFLVELSNGAELAEAIFATGCSPAELADWFADQGFALAALRAFCKGRLPQ